MDHPRADYDGVLAACQKAFGDGVLPLYVPVRGTAAITGLLGLLSGDGHGLLVGGRLAAPDPHR